MTIFWKTAEKHLKEGPLFEFRQSCIGASGWDIGTPISGCSRWDLGSQHLETSTGFGLFPRYVSLPKPCPTRHISPILSSYPRPVATVR